MFLLEAPFSTSVFLRMLEGDEPLLAISRMRTSQVVTMTCSAWIAEPPDDKSIFSSKQYGYRGPL
jgi:hypothetical protein